MWCITHRCYFPRVSLSLTEMTELLMDDTCVKMRNEANIFVSTLKSLLERHFGKMPLQYVMIQCCIHPESF